MNVFNESMKMCQETNKNSSYINMISANKTRRSVLYPFDWA